MPAKQNPFKVFSHVLSASGELAQFSRFLSFEDGETIISVDDLDDKVYFILSGSVKITNFSLKGKEIWHGTLDSGRTFGELAAMTGQARSASIVALERTRLAVVTRNELYSLMREDAEIAIWLLEDIASRLTQSTETVQELLSQSLPHRIRREIYRLAKAQNTPSEGGEMIIEPVPNLTALAKRLNTDREIVSREVSALTKRKVLRKEKTRMVLLDPGFFKDASR
ncbi:MAG: Crp/Fnr family transcriptional regulator [Pseudomonadota bacterium]